MQRCSLLALALAAACTGRDSGLGPGAATRDSAGVAIVRSRAPLWSADSGWRVADTPSVTIRVREGMRAGDIVGAIRTPSHAIAVGDGAMGTIRVYDLDGRYLRALGRRGSGIGEFQALSWITSVNDSILAFDLVTRRLTTFAASGRIRSAALDAGGATLIAPVDRFPDGTILVAAGGPTFPFPGGAGEVQRDSALLLAYGADGRVRDTLAHVPWGESFGVTIGKGEQQFLAPMPRPFARRTSAVVTGSDFAVGDGDRYDIAVFAADGALRRRVQRDRPPVPVSPEAIQGFKDAQRRARGAQGLQAQVDAALEAALDSAPYPAVLPVYERIVADEPGNLWVLDYGVRRDQAGAWSVFDPGGRWLGIVRTPPRFRVEAIGNDWVLGVWDDEAGVGEVRMYPLFKP